jgi:hypothetical protein
MTDVITGRCAMCDELVVDCTCEELAARAEFERMRESEMSDEEYQRGCDEMELAFERWLGM